VVALADKCWRGRRDEVVESFVSGLVANATQLPLWSVTGRVDDIVADLGLAADDRLAWQARYSA
jgi:hypothetical protein